MATPVKAAKNARAGNAAVPITSRDNRWLKEFRMALRGGMSVQTADGESQAARALLPASAQELTRWFLDEGFAHSGYFSTLGMAQWGSAVNRSASTTRKRVRALASTV